MSSEGETDPGSGSNGSEFEEQLLYTCKHCPESRFTAPERDGHRAFHRREREEAAAASASGRRGRPPRVPSPPASSVTLFEPIEAPSSRKKSKPGPKSRKAMQSTRKKTRPIRSYNQAYDAKTRGKKNPGA